MKGPNDLNELIDHDFIQTQIKGRPMLEQTAWIKINNQCHTLVDEDCKVIATISTPYKENDGDENFIWEVEVYEEEFGHYVSLYCAKLAVQRSIADMDIQIAETQKRSQQRRKKKEKIEKKKSVVKK